MLGLVGKYLYDHEKNKAHCTVHPITKERINLQPWFVKSYTVATKEAPPVEIVWRPATQDDFEQILKRTNPDGKKKNPLIGTLPPSIAEVKKKMFDKAMGKSEKKEKEKPAPIDSVEE